MSDTVYLEDLPFGTEPSPKVDDNEINEEDSYDPDEYKDIIDDVYMDSDGHFVLS